MESNSNSALFVDAAIAGGTLTLAYAADANGTADLTIRATDTQGAFVEDAFRVTVNAVNDPPTVAVALADVTADEDAVDTAINLGASFSDVDDATLTYTVESNSNPGLLGSATVAGGTLSLTNAVNASGTADLTIRGTDSAGAFVEDAFSVTVNPIADAPTLTVSAAAGDQDTAIPLSVSAALTDTDGSESLAIEISGVPSGAALSAGTDAGAACGLWHQGIWPDSH